MYDISNRRSFEEVSQNLQFLVLSSTNENIQIMLIGNKADLVSILTMQFKKYFILLYLIIKLQSYLKLTFSVA